jgi:hypothetical protein
MRFLRSDRHWGIEGNIGEWGVVPPRSPDIIWENRFLRHCLMFQVETEMFVMIQ